MAVSVAEPPRLLLASSRAPNLSEVINSVKVNVVVICFKYETSTLFDILVEVDRVLGQQKVESIAFLLHCCETQMFICFTDKKVLSTESIKRDPSVREFLMSLVTKHVNVMSPNSHIDFLNSPPSINTANFIHSLERLVACPVNLVEDITGVDFKGATVGELYFVLAKLQEQLQHKSKGGLLDGYEKIRTVGKGAFGTAVLYHKTMDDTLVVIKEINMIDLTASERQMALNEVQVISLLNHPNIISYLGSFEVDGVLMIEMEYADGGTLSQLISHRARMSEREILILFSQIVAALQYMHENNILHRDLKTANVFLTKDKSIKVGDFGISKMMTTKAQAQTVLGTPYYISPEMCEGKQYDQKSDIWALGCILYEMACLQKTFEGSNLPALVNKIMKGTFEPIPNGYSSDFRTLVSEMLQKDPTLRPTAAQIYERVVIMLNQTTDEEICSESRHSLDSSRSVLYQLSGHGPSFSLLPMQLPARCKITQVAVSNTHYVALTLEMMVYTWGEGKRGQLGHNEVSTWRQHPTCVEALNGRNIFKIGAGDGFSVFVSESGMLMTCGDGTFGCLGHGDWNSITKPQLVESLLSVDVVDMSCGDCHCAVMSGEGELFCWGRGEGGRLGLGHEQDCCTPTPVPLPQQLQLKSIHCGVDNTAIITKEGVVYACGHNTHNKLGLTYSIFQALGFLIKPIEKSLTFVQVKSLNKWYITDISLSTNHSAALTESGYLVTMGSNIEGQLGHDKTCPTLIKSMESRIITRVVCGPTYTVVGTVENALYFWGTRYCSNNQEYENSSESPTTFPSLYSEVVSQPQEILVLYASPSQIAKGEIVTLSDLNALWHTILVLVDTTVPIAKTNPQINKKEEQVQEQILPTEDIEFDTLGPIPDWIKDEVAQAENQWAAELFNTQNDRSFASSQD